jgi:hypothetical protein
MLEAIEAIEHDLEPLRLAIVVIVAEGRTDV